MSQEKKEVNPIEYALMHAIYKHAHHNTHKILPFERFREHNAKVQARRNDSKILIEPYHNDDAGVIQIFDNTAPTILKTESHCSPSVVNPYGSAATCISGAARDVVAMGGMPVGITDFIGTLGADEEILVGPCAFNGECSCGNCITMTSQERSDLMLNGMMDMCDILNLYIVAGGYSTSIKGITPAVVGTVMGYQLTEKPLTKVAKDYGDQLILIGGTNNDGNDTVYRANMTDEMRPAIPLFDEELISMLGAHAAFKTGKVKTCSDLGAAGLGAAVCESANYGDKGVVVDLSEIPLRAKNMNPSEIILCETQGRYLVQVDRDDVEEVLDAIRKTGADATHIGAITNDKGATFYKGSQKVAYIPRNPSDKELQRILRR